MNPIPSGLAALALALLFARAPARPQETSSSASAPGGAALREPGSQDPAVLRLRLLARLDAQIDAAATKAHLEARLMLEDVLPIAYLGVDADPVGEGRPGMRIVAVYEETGAKASGLRVGDVLLAIDDAPISVQAELGGTVRSRRPGEAFVLHVLRDGAPLELRGSYTSRPAEDEDEEEQFPELFGPAPSPPTPRTFAFEGAGELDAFEPILAGGGAPGAWSVEPGAWLRQTSRDRTSLRFPMLIVRQGVWSDVVARVRVRLVSGVVDQAAGVVLRYRDPGNYLVARVNAGEGDLRLFRVVNGVRRTLPGAMQPVTLDDGWHTLEARAEGPRVSATIDGGEPIMSYDTYLRRGRVGLWTKADAVSDFDELKLTLPGD